MKKLILLLLSLMLLVAFVACDSDTPPAGSDSTPEAVTSDSNMDESEETVIVEFRANKGEFVNEDEETEFEIEFGGRLKKSQAPDVIREGYDFVGWYFTKTAEEGEEWKSSYEFEEDTIIYACWEKAGSASSTPSSTPNSTPNSTPSSTPTTPTIVPDTTRYTPKTSGEGDSAVIYYINEAIKYPQLTPYYNGYKTALTMTFDDGYHTQTGTYVSDQFEKYGFRGTMMLGVCFINNQECIDEWNRVFARGYLDLGCHGYDHKNPVEISADEYEREIKDAVTFLRENFPGQRVLTFATPLAHINAAYEEYLSDYVLGNRLEEEGSFINYGQSLDYNPYRVKAISVNTRVYLGAIHEAVATNIEYGNWMVELFHCVTEGASNLDTELSVFQYHCEYLYRNFRDDLWITTFEDVLVYGEQLKHIAIEYTDCDRESMTFTVTPDGTLDKELYKIPVSLKVYMPNTLTDSAYATVNGEYQPLDLLVEKQTGYKYVIVRDISAIEESEVVVYIGGNKTMRNNCVHQYSVDEVIEPTHDTFGYTVNKCKKCETTYNSNFTSVVHDYTGKQEEVIAPSEEDVGLTKFYCTHCDKYEVREVPYEE